MTQPSPAQPESSAGESAPAVPAPLQHQQAAQQAAQQASAQPLPLQGHGSKPLLTLAPQGERPLRDVRVGTAGYVVGHAVGSPPAVPRRLCRDGAALSRALR